MLMNPDNGHGLAEIAPAPALRNETAPGPKAAAELALRLAVDDLPLDLKELIQEIERGIIVRVLARVRGNQKEAAQLLGLKHTTLNEKVKRFGIGFRKFPVA
jgi:DNA-binding NtrC family response regulator